MIDQGIAIEIGIETEIVGIGDEVDLGIDTDIEIELIGVEVVVEVGTGDGNVTGPARRLNQMVIK